KSGRRACAYKYLRHNISHKFASVSSLQIISWCKVLSVYGLRCQKPTTFWRFKTSFLARFLLLLTNSDHALSLRMEGQGRIHLKLTTTDTKDTTFRPPCICFLSFLISSKSNG